MAKNFVAYWLLFDDLSMAKNFVAYWLLIDDLMIIHWLDIDYASHTILAIFFLNLFPVIKIYVNGSWH